MPREAVHAIAQGRVWSGKDALELGLVDALGNLNDAIEVAAARAHLEGDYGVKVIEPETSTIKAMISEMLAANPLSIPTTQVVSDAAHALNWVSELHGVQARLPYLIQVR